MFMPQKRRTKMQDASEVTHTDSERRTGTRFGTQRPRVWAAILICLAALVSVGRAQEPQTAPPAQSDAKKVFEGLKALTGSWQGTIMGLPITFTMRAASSGTALLLEGHTEAAAPPKHEITTFYLDGDRLLATHYCDSGNRSRWEGKMSADAKSIVLSFVDVTGSTRGGYLRGMTFSTIDANNITIEGTFATPDGKVVPLRGDFQRSK
jgi:hypothetical protein